MHRRTAMKISLALVLVLVASLSTVRVRQAWGQQQAQSAFDKAQASAGSALKYAAGVGLVTGELAPYVRSKAALDAVKSPSTSIFWGSQEAFYNRQAQAYRNLVNRIQLQIRRVATQTRAQANASVTSAATAIAKARSLELDESAAARQLGEQRAVLATASTPRAYRAVVTAVGPIGVAARSAADFRSRYVDGVVASVNDSVAGVVQLADNEMSAANGKLSLVSLFSPEGKLLASQISSWNGAVHAQKTAYAAAVKEAQLHLLLGKVDPLTQKVVPSRVILVSTEDQWAHMYLNGQEVYNTAVTTGGPELPTDHGIFHIYAKFSPFVFHSPWPLGSPYYYPPTPISYWMPFDGGEGLHDASWRSNFGPGSNLAPTDLGTGYTILGTHGCVNLPYDAAAWVWDWAPIGTTVVVV